jgi:hypothetical protein
MARHRFLEQLQPAGPEMINQPSPVGFMACPAALQQWMSGAAPWQERVYALAMAEARAVVRPSILDRLAANLQN